MSGYFLGDSGCTDPCAPALPPPCAKIYMILASNYNWSIFCSNCGPPPTYGELATAGAAALASEPDWSAIACGGSGYVQVGFVGTSPGQCASLSTSGASYLGAGGFGDPTYSLNPCFFGSPSDPPWSGSCGPPVVSPAGGPDDWYSGRVQITGPCSAFCIEYAIGGTVTGHGPYGIGGTGGTPYYMNYPAIASGSTLEISPPAGNPVWTVAVTTGACDPDP